jgi:hypothetical protein
MYSVVYSGLDQSLYLKVNLTSSVLDHVVAPAVLPDLKRDKLASRPAQVEVKQLQVLHAQVTQ